MFLLSPASTSGKRAAVLLNPAAEFDLAERLRTEGATIGELFSFLSGLYFRGKLAYAREFSAAPDDVLVMTACRGLVSPDARIWPEVLREFSAVPIDLAEPRYLEPLRRDITKLSRRVGPKDEVVLLGSVATGKYAVPLTEVFGEKLVFPVEFVGRGDMSRGGLMLRSVLAGRELEYQPVATAVRHGARPPKL